MHKVFILTCCAFVLLCNTSCKEYVDIENIPMSQDVTTQNPNIEKLIQQARQGETKAYDALAVCYRDGNGVKQSVINMITMYMLSYQRNGKDTKDIIKSLDENHPLRLLIEMADYVRFEDVPQELVTKIQSASTSDALIYDAIYALKCKNDTLASQRLLKEAEAKGSEIACFLQILITEYPENTEKYEQLLRQYADRFPVLYVKLGDLSMQKEHEGHWEQAVKYYTLADNFGMLTAYGAFGLFSAYQILEKEGKMKCNRQEMARLESLIQHKP